MKSQIVPIRDSYLARFLILVALISVTTIAIGADRTNVLFIAVDDLKPTLGCYGDSTAVTPAIDRLAKQGTVFTNAHCQWPVCGPSRASLMTSLRPEATGVLDLKTSMRAKDPNILTLPQHFKNQGYLTAGAGKIYDPRCVDEKTAADAPSWSIPFAKMKYGGLKYRSEKRFAVSAEVDDEQLTDGHIRVNGVRLLHQLAKSDQPFFLAVGFKKPHLPFVAPKKYWDLYDRDRFTLATYQGGIENASGFSIHESGEMRRYKGIPESGELSEDLQREAIHGYYACTSFVDAQVGMLLDELETLGLAETTTVVLWGDHGFHLGDHGMWGKHSTLEQATRVPLIIKPARIKADSETVSPVELSDMFPTLCESSGIDIPQGLSGKSLMPLIRGEANDVRDGALTVFRSKGKLGYSLRGRQFRYTQWHDDQGQVIASELYDYKSDPLEKTNEIENPAYAQRVKTMAAQMRATGSDCDLMQGRSAIEGIATDVLIKKPKSKKTKSKKTRAKKNSTAQTAPVPTGPRLREIAPIGGKIPLLIGGTISRPMLGTSAETILNREFQFVTPANMFKQAAIHPEPGKWDWERADMWVDRCEERGDLMRLHACVSPQCSAWAEEDHRTPEELRKIMHEYVEAVCKRYANRKHIGWIDVVNETVTREGEWFGPKPGVGKWQNPWTQIGFDETHPLRPPLYIKEAFEIAEKNAPHIKLLINQHGGMEPEAWKKVCATAMYLREKGVRIDGIGWQGHITVGFEKEDGNMRRLNQLIAWAHKRSLEFHVTENTVWFPKAKDGVEVDEEAMLQAQADTYTAIASTLLAHSGHGTVSWNHWQMRDSDTQRYGRRGNLFDDNGNPKPAYYAVQKVLQQHAK